MDQQTLMALRRWEAHVATQRALMQRMTVAMRDACQGLQEFGRVWIAGSSWEQWKRSPQGRASRLK